MLEVIDQYDLTVVVVAQIISSAIFIFPMWFWINFSPIGQAPPSSKKASDSPNEKKGDVQPEKKLEG